MKNALFSKKAVLSLMVAAGIVSSAVPAVFAGGNPLQVTGISADCKNNSINFKLSYAAEDSYSASLGARVGNKSYYGKAAKKVSINKGVNNLGLVVSMKYDSEGDAVSPKFEGQKLEYIVAVDRDYVRGTYTVKCSSTPSKDNNTFHKDTRCLDTTPAAITRASVVNSELKWVALGGSKMEVKFGSDAKDLKYSFKTLNDGHEVLGKLENTGPGSIKGTQYLQMRTINGCKQGPWSETITGYFN